MTYDAGPALHHRARIVRQQHELVYLPPLLRTTVLPLSYIYTPPPPFNILPSQLLYRVVSFSSQLSTKQLQSHTCYVTIKYVLISAFSPLTLL